MHVELVGILNDLQDSCYVIAIPEETFEQHFHLLRFPNHSLAFMLRKTMTLRITLKFFKTCGAFYGFFRPG